MKGVLDLLKQTVSDWLDDKAPSKAAALAFYTLFSLAPLLILVVSIAGLAFGEEAARGGIVTQLHGILGDKGAQAVQDVLANSKTHSSGILGTIVGVVVALFGASGLFGELQDSLNVIWDVQPKPGRGVRGFLRDRFFSFAMVMGVAFLLLVSLVFTAVLSALGTYFASALPGGTVVWQILNSLISVVVTAVLFGLIFKVVPDVKVQWRDVRIGALATAILFTLGKLGIGLYIGRASVSSPFGAAGSLVVLVIWVFYSAQLMFFGAEFTQVWARRHGAHVAPDANAVEMEPAKPVGAPASAG